MILGGPRYPSLELIYIVIKNYLVCQFSETSLRPIVRILFSTHGASFSVDILVESLVLKLFSQCCYKIILMWEEELVELLLWRLSYHYPTSTMYLVGVKMSWCVMKASGVYIMWKNFPFDWCFRIQDIWLFFEVLNNWSFSVWGINENDNSVKSGILLA